MNAPQPDVTRALAIVARRWKTVAVFTLAVVAVAWLYTQVLADPVYESQAMVTYQEPDRTRNPTGGQLPSTGVTRENIQTLIGMAGQIGVLKDAAKAARTDVDTMRESVKLRPHGEASTIDFVARDGSAAGAARLANAYAAAFVADRKAHVGTNLDRQIAGRAADLKALGRPRIEDPRAAVRVQLETQLSDLRAQRQQWVESILVSGEAQAPREPVWPRTLLSLLAATIVGFGLGCGVALLTARVDRRLHGEELDVLPAPVLVKVPMSQRAPKTMPLGPGAAEPLVSDAFAALGARVMLDRSGEGAHVILVSSARSGEGKSTVAANLASALAQGGRRVVLIDADMRRPTQDKIFPVLQGRPGLSQVLAGSVEVEHSLTLVGPNLAAIPSGPRQQGASMLLASVAFRQLVERLGGISEVVVIDAPPVLAVNDAQSVASIADQVLVCARIGTSNVGELEEAHARLASAASTPQAMVVLGTERPVGYGYDNEVAPTRIAYPPGHGGGAAPQGGTHAGPGAAA